LLDCDTRAIAVETIQKTRAGASVVTYEEFCTVRQPFGLGYCPTAIEAIKGCRPTAAQLAETAEPLAEHGGDHQSEDFQGNKVTLKERGNKAAYLTRRITRDRPDVLARMKAGAYPSVRAAA
jgi:hypothetical protein